MMELEEIQGRGANVKVIGVGGGGGNAIDTMIEAGVEGVQFISANTDMQALARNHAEVKIQLGPERSKGLGAGANPTVGQEAAQESATQIQEYLKQSDMVFVTAGMGGGTGTGAAPVIAGLARQLGALTVAVVTKPFKFEGGRRRRQAEEGIKRLRQNVDALITIPNNRLSSIAGEEMTLLDAFKMANSVLMNAVRSISDLVTNNGIVNLDFEDVRTIMANKGIALMGTGYGEGENRAIKAAEEAINSPLLDDMTIDGASSILINITGPRNISLSEVTAAGELIAEAASEDANIIWGQGVNDDDSEIVKVTVIATGFGNLENNENEAGASASASNSGMFNSARSGSFVSQSGFHPAVGGNMGYGNAPVYQDTLSSGSYPPADLARRMQEYDARAESIYSNNNGNSGMGRERDNVGRVPASYAPTGASASMQPGPMPDIYAPMAGPGEPRAASNSGTVAAVGRDGMPLNIGRDSAPLNVDRTLGMDNVSLDKSLDDLLPDEEDIDKPAYMRRNSPKRNFLDM